MGEFVIKAAHDLDLYVVWSTARDGAELVGTREQICQYWRAEYGRSSGPAAMLDRVDRTGTSVRARSYGPRLTGAWADPQPLLVMHPAPGGHLPRARLAAYAQALLEQRESDAAALLDPRPAIVDQPRPSGLAGAAQERSQVDVAGGARIGRRSARS